jgi:hypothetical protein
MGRLREILEEMKDPAYIQRPGLRAQEDAPEQPPMPMEGMEGKPVGPNPNTPLRPSAFSEALQTPSAQEAGNVQASPELTPRQRMLRHMTGMQARRQNPQEMPETVLSGGY